MLSQVSVFLENAKGTLSEMTNLLADSDVNMDFLAVADTAEFGLVRILCDKPQLAIEALRREGFIASLTPVIAVELDDEVGSLAKLFAFAESRGVDISYAYCFVDPKTRAALGIIKVPDSTFEAQLVEQGYCVL